MAPLSKTPSPQDFIQHAFDIAAFHPEHPLSGILRSKARALSLEAQPASLAEMRLLLEQADAWLARQRQQPLG